MISRIASILASLAFALVAKADTVTIGSSENSNVFPFGLYAGEYQQAYSAGAFSGPVIISAITFFPDPLYFHSEQFPSIYGDYLISLSTTTASLNGLGSTYAANIGADNSIFTSGIVNGVFTFTGTPFTYDPAKGNLLLDVKLLAPINTYTVLLAGCSNQTARIYGGTTAGTVSTPASCLQNFSSDGLETQFTSTPATTTTTPEPTSLLLLGTGALCLYALSRRRRLT